MKFTAQRHMPRVRPTVTDGVGLNLARGSNAPSVNDGGGQADASCSTGGYRRANGWHWALSLLEALNAFEMSRVATNATGHEYNCSRCPLYPRKRTCAVRYAMSALGQ